MELINATRMVAGYNMGLEPSGRELLVVVIKGTFAIPKNGEPVRLVDEQVPLIMSDTFSGEPGFSAPVCENDFAPRNPGSELLLVRINAYRASEHCYDECRTNERRQHRIECFGSGEDTTKALDRSKQALTSVPALLHRFARVPGIRTIGLRWYRHCVFQIKCQPARRIAFVGSIHNQMRGPIGPTQGSETSLLLRGHGALGPTTSKMLLRSERSR